LTRLRKGVREAYMPNRVIREGIIDSARIEALVRDVGWPGEVFYRRLLSIVDDFGRFDARVAMLKSRCYPTVPEMVREADLQRWIAACVKAGLVRLYEVEGRNYLEIVDFRQFTRAKRSKFPAPPGDATHVQCIRNASAPGDGDGDGDGDEVAAQPRRGRVPARGPPAAENGQPKLPGLEDGPGVKWETAKGVEIPPSLRTPGFRDTWSEWEKHLAEKRVSRGPTADRHQLAKLAPLGAKAAIEAISHAIASAWQSIHPARGRGERNGMKIHTNGEGEILAIDGLPGERGTLQEIDDALSGGGDDDE